MATDATTTAADFDPLADDFVRFASQPEPQAEFARRIGVNQVVAPVVNHIGLVAQTYR